VLKTSVIVPHADQHSRLRKGEQGATLTRQQDRRSDVRRQVPVRYRYSCSRIARRSTDSMNVVCNLIVGACDRANGGRGGAKKSSRRVPRAVR
jgi:hypothetical protein